MFDINGKDILKGNSVTYQFWDNKFGKKRILIVNQRLLEEDFCISESDTVYNYFATDEDFKIRLQHFYQYLENNVVYPGNALKKGIQCMVKVAFFIDKGGRIHDTFALTKHDWGFEEALIKAIKDKNQFGFVLYRGKPVNYYMEVPFSFKIKSR